jgi:hypothetical protein
MERIAYSDFRTFGRRDSLGDWRGFNSYKSSLMKQRLNADFTNASGGGIIFYFSQVGKKPSFVFDLNPCLARI